VLLITLDTLRADRLGCYGCTTVPTPNIDALAERSVLFTRAFAHNPTTLPSHTNILLGATPLYHGVRENANYVVRGEFTTLAEFLKGKGYATAAVIGGYPLHSRFGLAQGFDVYDDAYEKEKYQKLSVGERKAEEVVERGLEWLGKAKPPWFLWIHCFDPHDPYEPPQPFRSRFEGKLYDGEVAYLDQALGKLFRHLEDRGLFEDTVVVLTGDHGESLGQHGERTHGFLAYNSTIWIPLIISVPGMNARRVESFVCHVDIFPTICDALRESGPEDLQGVSLLPAMKGKKIPRRTIYFESLYPYYSRGWAPLRGILGKEEVIKFIDSPIPELYDLEKDFEESENLAPHSDLSPLRKELERVTRGLTRRDSGQARQALDKRSLDRLRSLGYISSAQVYRKESFGPEDDVKTLLPYHNRSVRAMELFQEGKKKEGLEMVKQVITERKDVDVAYSNLAEMYKEEGRVEDALAVLEAGIRNLPSSYGVVLSYARCLREAGRDEELIAFVSGLDFPPMEHDPEIWDLLGEAFLHRGELDKAREVLERACAIDGEYAVAFRNLGDAILTMYMKRKEKDLLPEAIRSYERAVELEPDYASAYNRLGVAYREAGRPDRAVSCWEKALELRPDVGYPLLNLGLLYLSRGEKARALEYFLAYRKEHAASLSPEEGDRLEALIRRCRK